MFGNDSVFDTWQKKNIEIDVWIDEEEYGNVYEELAKYPIIMRYQNEFLNAYFEGEDKKEIEKKLKDSSGQEKIQKEWGLLFFVKCFRAFVMQNGTDNYLKHLDEVVIFLQKNLPYSNLSEPGDDKQKQKEQIILQSLYFQELSACAKPGVQSLGFALQAKNILTQAKEKNILREDSKECEINYLWALLNEGIGYSHSKQKKEAIEVFDEIIKKFKEKEGDFDENEKGLLWYSALLSKAEILEKLQFSYHTIETLSPLLNIKDGGRNYKQDRALIKKALAYRDMSMLEKAKHVICYNLSGISTDAEIKQVFGALKCFSKKPSMKSQFWGLLIDYYFEFFKERCEQIDLESRNIDRENDPKRKMEREVLLQKNKKELIQKINSFVGIIKNPKKYIEKIYDIKQDRTGFFVQIAKFLRFLVEDIERIVDIKDIKRTIEEIYCLLENENFPVSTQSLKNFDIYEYDIYAKSLEKFYKKFNSSYGNEFKEAEIVLLKNLNDFEKDKKVLLEYKKLERKFRIDKLEMKVNGLTKDNPGLLCFDENGKNKGAFSGLLECCDEKESPINYSLVAKDYENIMQEENNQFLNHLKDNSIHHNNNNKESYHFMGLQRWNSQTPALALSQGGGYLIYKRNNTGKVDLGIAIDPGFDFIDNLFHRGFTLNDIDFILISHAHSDHMRDFEPLISLLLDLQKRGTVEKKFHVIMTMGVYDKLKHVINNPTLREYLADTYIIDINKRIEENFIEKFHFKKETNRFLPIIEKNPTNWDIQIEPTKAYHNDFSEISDSFGYIIRFREDENDLFSIGYTGDTKWIDDKMWSSSSTNKGKFKLAEQYECCDVICIHMGALIQSDEDEKFEKYDKCDKCNNLIEKKGHPYLFGLLRFIKDIKEKWEKDNKSKKTLLLISEFGEELKGGIRIDFLKRLNEFVSGNSNLHCLPVDIGLDVLMREKKEGSKNSNGFKVFCYGCDNFVDADKIDYRHYGYGRDEALFYFCSTCMKSKPENILTEKMKRICEFGIPLQKANE